MSTSRLTTALQDGLLVLPDGDIVVIRPAAGADLSALPKDRTRIATGFRPDYDHWQAAGFAVTRDPGAAALAIVHPSRSKALSRALIAEAARIAPRVAVDGARTDGVDSLWREVRSRRQDVEGLAKAHGRLFVFDGGPAFEDWQDPGPVPVAEGFVTRAGVFAEAGPDRGSVLLAQALPKALPKRVADLGAGWGYLARAILDCEGVQSLDLVEAEALALDCARLNVTDPRAAFHWADVRNFKPAALYDAIVMNPPFHTGRAGDPDLGRAFIATARTLLTPGGQLWLVANRHLPYEAALSDAFRTVQEVGGDGGFKVIRATQPKRAR